MTHLILDHYNSLNNDKYHFAQYCILYSIGQYSLYCFVLLYHTVVSYSTTGEVQLCSTVHSTVLYSTDTITVASSIILYYDTQHIIKKEKYRYSIQYSIHQGYCLTCIILYWMIQSQSQNTSNTIPN